MTEPVAPVIDLELLNRALRAAGLLTEGPAGTVPSFDSHYLGRFSNDVWRLDLDHGIQLLVKRAFERASADADVDHERAFYRTFGRRADLPIPRFIAEIDETLILEFQPLTSFSFRLGATREHAEQAIDALADWHAAWWQQPPAVAWIPDYADHAVRLNIQNAYDRAWKTHGQQLLEYAPAFEEIGCNLVGRLADTLEPMAVPSTFIHGDAHAENLPLCEAGTVLMLDWQEPALANPGYDLAVFTTMSFISEDRAGCERELVARHARHLAARGCYWPDPWTAYRLGLLRRAARIVEIAGRNFSSLAWVFERSARAAIEQRVGELIVRG